MALKIAGSLLTYLTDAADVAAAFGFKTAVDGKKKELEEKLKKLKKDVEAAGDLYDRVYYLVIQNMRRLMNAVEQLPTDLLTQTDSTVKRVLQQSHATEVLSMTAVYVGVSAKTFSSISDIVGEARDLKARRKTEPGISGDADNPWRDLSTADVPSSKGTTGRSKVAKKLLLGVDVAGRVFSIGGLALTIGLGAANLTRLNEAIAEVEKKQQEVDTYQAAMKKVLGDIAESAGLRRTSTFDEIVRLFEGMRKASEVYEEYIKGFKYAIKYYYRGQYTLDQIKTMVQRRMDPTALPLADSTYVLARDLANGIHEKFDQGKSDVEIIDFYKSNPNKKQRFVLDEYFISELRYED